MRKRYRQQQTSEGGEDERKDGQLMEKFSIDIVRGDIKLTTRY